METNTQRITRCREARVAFLTKRGAADRRSRMFGLGYCGSAIRTATAGMRAQFNKHGHIR